MQRSLMLIGPALCAASLLAPVAARADAAPADASSPPVDTRPPHEFHPLVGALLTGNLSSNPVAVTNPDGSTASGNFGARYELFAGGEFPLTQGGLRLRLTAGLHVAPLSASSGGGEHLTTFPLEAALVYPVDDDLRVGAGAHYAMRMRFSGPGANSTDGLNAVPGVFAFLEYRIQPHLWLDGRYVSEYYEDAGGDSFNTGHWGLGALAEF